MTNQWLKTIGGKLINTGVAYLQQKKFVQELRCLPPDQARERFLYYVNSLSPMARVGFSLTLTRLIKNEQNIEIRRFFEKLQASLANPTTWPEVQSESTDLAPSFVHESTTSRTDPIASFDDDLMLLEKWSSLDEVASRKAIDDHIAMLNDQQIDRFKEHLKQMRDNVVQCISAHRKNEALIAAGRFVEDQMSYRMRRIAGLPPDENWLATLRNHERSQAFLAMVFSHLEKAQNVQSKPLAATLNSESTTARQNISEASSSNPEAAEQVNLPLTIQKMRQTLEEMLAEGTVIDDRRLIYQRFLDKIESVTKAKASGDIKPTAVVARMQGLIDDFLPYLANPGIISVKASPRGRKVAKYAGELRTELAHEIRSSPEAEMSGALGAINGDITKALSAILETHDEAKLAEIESGLLRPAARSWHELILTRHAMIVRPLWECNEIIRSVNTVFYSGASDLQVTLARAIEGKKLTVENTPHLQQHGQQRWNQLNACHVAIFDFRNASDIAYLANHAPKRARELTGTAYELGLAFSLGKPVIVLSNSDETLPFDIDLNPVILDGKNDEEILANALDQAFYVSQRKSKRNSIPATLVALDHLTRNHPRRTVIEGMQWIDPTLSKNPAGFNAAVYQVLREINDPQWQLLRPSWPGTYPDPAQPSCFHVMPFRPSWADEVRDTAKTACEKLLLDYRRGDDAEEGRIIYAIWDHLCRANVVLVELAGGNLNVMIELGIAHALGRPTLAVQHIGNHDLRPLHIEKLRVHTYETTKQLSGILMHYLKP